VLVPAAATGTQIVTLRDVKALDNGMHGVLVNDQSGYLLDPNSTDPAGSDAGLQVHILGGRYEDNGLTALDQDGIRINEGGLGDLVATIHGAVVLGNGGDGIELDERALGNAVFEVRRSQLNGNGF
jgi:hypothetical protein